MPVGKMMNMSVFDKKPAWKSHCISSNPCRMAKYSDFFDDFGMQAEAVYDGIEKRNALILSKY